MYKFGGFEADFVKRQLKRGDQLVPVTPKVFQTLEILLRNRERIVSKQELLSTIWPDCHIEEANVTQNISVLRKTLGEGNCGAKFVATFPKQGYRFTGEVAETETEVEAENTSPATPVTRRSFRYPWLGGLILLPLALFGTGNLVHDGVTRREWLGRELTAQRAVTHLPGRQYQPALSPDGARVAFVSHQELDGLLRIGVVDLAPASKPRWLETGTGDAFSPAWSPDGNRLAYLRAYNRRVTVVLQDLNGKPEELTEIFPESCGVVARRLDWSPDGRFLAVSTKSGADEPFRIELIHIAEKSRTVLTNPPELSDGDFQPRFSPDGTRLAFVRTRDLSTMEILFMPIPGGDPVAATATKQPFGDVDWTPDSGSLLFSTQREGRSEIHNVSIKPGIGMAKEDFVAVKDGSGGLLQFSASRQTGSLVWAHAQPDESIWRGTLTRTHEVAAWKRVISSAGIDFSPVYSPDSRRIAFLSDRTGDQQLWIRDLDGHEHEMTFGQLKPGAASWTANGDEVVFPSLRQRVLYRMRVNGGQPIPIQVGTVGSHTAVSPGGELVYFVRRFYIMQAPSSGGQPSQLTDEGGFPLRMSPDGDWIYYVRHRYSGEIWRLRRSDGFTERVTDRLRPGCWACWSVSAGGLVYVPTGDSGVARLERLDLISGQIRDLGQLPGRLPPLGLGMVALSPDDSSVALVVAEPGTGDLKIAEQTPWSQTVDNVLFSQRFPVPAGGR